MSVSNDPLSKIPHTNTNQIPSTTQKRTKWVVPTKIDKQEAEVIKQGASQNQAQLTLAEKKVHHYGRVPKNETATTANEVGANVINHHPLQTRTVEHPNRSETTKKTQEVAYGLIHMSEESLKVQVKNPIHANQINAIFNEGFSHAQEWALEAKAQGKTLFYDLATNKPVTEFKDGWGNKSSLPLKNDVAFKNLIAVTPNGQIYKLTGFLGAGEFKNTYNTLLIAGPHFQKKSEGQTLVKAVGFTKNTLEEKNKQLSQLQSENDINALKEDIKELEKEVQQEKALNNALWQTKKESRNDPRIPDPLPHVLTAHAVEFEGQTAFIAPLGQGDLASQKLLSANQKAQLGRDISSALSELQSFQGNEAFSCPNGIAHRDIHPGNVLIKDGKYHLMDLGKSEKIGATNTTSYMFDSILPPEYTEPGDTIIDPKSDIYQLGLVLYAAYTEHSLDFKLDNDEKNPLNEMHKNLHDSSWRNRRYDHPEEWPGIASIIPPAVKEKILEMLSRDPSKRPTAEEVHKFFEAQVKALEPSKPAISPWRTKTSQEKKTAVKQASQWVTKKPTAVEQPLTSSKATIGTERVKTETLTSDPLVNTILGLDSAPTLEKLTPALGWMITSKDLVAKDGVKAPLTTALEQVKAEKNPDKAGLMMANLLQFCEKVAKHCFSAEQKNKFKESKTFQGDEAILHQQMEDIRAYAKEKFPNNLIIKLASKEAYKAYSDNVTPKITPITSKKEGTNSYAALDTIASPPLFKKGPDSDEFAQKMAKDLRTQFSALFANVDVRELQNSAWMAKDKEKLAPNLLKLMRAGNKLSQDIKETIFFDSKHRARSATEVRRIVAFYTEVADKCVKDGNIAGAQAIFSALNSSAVRKVISEGDTLDQKLGEDTVQKLNKLQAVFLKSELRNKAMEASKAPIPYIGSAATTLNKINDENAKSSASKPKLILNSAEIIGNLQAMQAKQPKSTSANFETDLLTTRPQLSDADYASQERIYEEIAQKLKPKK